MDERIALEGIRMRNNVMKAALSLSAIVMGVNAPVAVAQTSGADTYAQSMCGYGSFQGYGSYEACYAEFYAAYWTSIGGGGNDPIDDGGVGGDSGGGGGGSLTPGPYPWNPGGDNCTARTRLCDDGGTP